MSSRSSKPSTAELTANEACSRNPSTVTPTPWATSSSSGSRKARLSPEATSSWRSTPCSWRDRMCVSMSSSMSDSSIFGLAKTANPVLRSASTQGLTKSVLPGATLVNTVASGSVSVPARAINHRPRASNRGRDAELGRPPKMEPRLMSILGASQTSRVIGMVEADTGFMGTDPAACACTRGRHTQQQRTTRRISASGEEQVAHYPAVVPGALLEFGDRPPEWAGGELCGGVAQGPLSSARREHLLRVGLPVGGQVQKAARRQPGRQQGDELGTDRAAPVA